MLRWFIFVIFFVTMAVGQTTTWESKYIYLVSTTEVWQHQIQQEGDDGWIVAKIRDHDSWLIAIRNSEVKLPVKYKYLRAKLNAKPQIEQEGNNGWRYANRYRDWLVFRKIEGESVRWQYKRFRLTGNESKWQNKIQRAGRAGWEYLETYKKTAMFTKRQNTSQVFTYKFVKPEYRLVKQHIQMQNEGKNGWRFVGEYDSWLILLR